LKFPLGDKQKIVNLYISTPKGNIMKPTQDSHDFLPQAYKVQDLVNYGLEVAGADSVAEGEVETDVEGAAEEEA
jgi:hypothetical protein